MDKQRFDQFRKDIEKLQADFSFKEQYAIVQAKLMDQLAKYDVKDVKTLWKLRKIISPLFHEEWEKYIDKIFLSYNLVIELVNDLYGNMGVDISRNFDSIRALEYVNRTNLGAYEKNEITRIAKDIRKGIRKDENHKEIGKRIAKAGGRVESYAQTIARTQVKGYGQFAKMEKARIAEVVWYEYVGVIRPATKTSEGSREFCRNLLKPGEDHHHNINEINAMRNENLEPVITYCGGWNCHHFWEPDPLFKKEER